ncbi:MAG TPA: chorismate mutase [Bacteroidia bacterium]|jgi:chorismate mutase|nr:chorismate mutase [Bacteroidia bacterium]
MTNQSINLNPVLIAGPCSAETEQQVLGTAKAIALKIPQAIFRAGIWKPRTRPNSFEGVGSIGLPWLRRVKEETGMQTMTEVANARHVEECMKAGVDMLWVGARSTVSPFTVQEIAEALKGCSIPVWIKNPVNAELSLWIGAIERFDLMGVKNIGAIHRGFHSSEPRVFRNEPQWDLAMKMRSRIPGLPMICDPSHISGNRELIPYVARKALDLGMDGLMIESHQMPSKALSDAQQQLSPDELFDLINKLGIFASSLPVEAKDPELQKLRASINRTDEALLDVLSQRMHIAEEIGTYKKKNKLAVLQEARWEELLRSRLEVAGAMGLNRDFVKNMYDLIHLESIRKQTDLTGN